MSRHARFRAAFETLSDGQRFTMQWIPADRVPSRALVLLPPFGEEMNKSRRTIALAARLFASQGIAVYAFDLAGTGDSVGEFGEATWVRWTFDARAAIAIAEQRFAVHVTIWAVRSGSLLLPGLESPLNDLLLWQPVTSGDAFLTQLLRLKVANDAFAGRDGTTTKQLRALLAAGEILEVAGYELNPDLVLPMAAASLQSWQPGTRRVSWIETGVESAGALSPASQRIAEWWAASGTAVDSRHVAGDAFWQTQEVSENVEIGRASLDALSTHSA
jgi:exosortase A-associated hydrolase 2